MPEPGEVYYSARAKRFYQVGRRGAVSRETALGFLEYDERRAAFRDVRGNLIPDAQLLSPGVNVVRTLGRDRFGRPFLTIEFRDRSISQTEATQAALANNEMLVTRIVVKTPDGKAHVVEVSSTMGGRPNIEDQKQAAYRRARARLIDQGYTLSTHEVQTATVSTSFIRRRVNVVR